MGFICHSFFKKSPIFRAMNKKYFFALFVLAISLCCFSFKLVHEYYISITSIDYNSKTKSLEITQQFIAHDVEKAILKESNIDLNLSEPNEYPKADSLLFAYVSNHFELKSSNVVKLTYVGKEISLDETLWIYIQSDSIEKPKSLTIINTVLTEVFEAQSNITHVNFGSKQQTQSFNKLKKNHTFSIN